MVSVPAKVTLAAGRGVALPFAVGHRAFARALFSSTGDDAPTLREAVKSASNEDEAKTVRMIFERYLALGSLPALQRELRTQGIVTRKRTQSSGKTVGGASLTNGPLAYMLRNRMYLGEINHRDQSYPSEHQPILEQALFDQVQARLDENKHARRLKNERSQALLLGKLFDDRGNRMTPSYAIKNHES